MWQCSILDLAGLLRARAASTSEVAQALLDRIAALDPSLRAFITVDPEVTLRQAREAQAALDRGADLGILHGIPVSLKDAIDTADMRTTIGAAVFADRRPRHDAHVTRALRAAGAVILGKTNLLEFCWGPTDAHPFGQAANPWDLRHSAGGSSSGGGAAVAAGLGPVSIGTDTGGSVRNPAAFCGVVGLKPTFGVVGRTGVFPLSFTLDHVGVLTRRVEDAAVMLTALAMPDPHDPGAGRRAQTDYLRQMREDTPRPPVLIPRAHFWEHLDAEVQTRAEEAIEVFGRLGYVVREITLPHAEAARVAVQGIILPEAAWYHGRLVAETREGISEAFRARITQGAALPATAYAEALHARQQFRAAVAASLGGGLLLTPVSPYPPFSLDDPMATGRGAPTRVIGQCTGPFNVAGTPAIALPCGFTPQGLPVAIQLVGLWHEEPALLKTALEYERATGWWQRWPAAALTGP